MVLSFLCRYEVFNCRVAPKLHYYPDLGGYAFGLFLLQEVKG